MNRERAEISKVFTSAFVLDKAKLTRILNIMEERYSEAELKFSPSFEVTLSSNRHIRMSSVDQLLDLDNSVKSHITSIEISAYKIEEKGALICALSFSSTNENNISISVQTSVSKLGSQLFAELEEQVERTFSSSWIHRFSPANVVIGIAGIALSALFIAFLVFGDTSGPLKSVYMLSPDEVSSFAKRSKEITNTNDKIDFLFALQSRQLERSVTKQETETVHFGKVLTVKNLLIMLPLVIILGCIVYLQQTSYPFAVFLWGDYEEYYNRLLSKRKTIWTVVIISMFIGILGNLFAVGLSSSIH